MIKHIEYSDIRRFFGKIFKWRFIIYVVLFAVDKIINRTTYTPEDIPKDREEVNGVLERYETGWSVWDFRTGGEKIEIVLKTSLPEEMREKVHEFDFNNNIIGMITLDYNENGILLTFKPNIPFDADSSVNRQILKKAAKVSRELYGFDSVGPAVRYTMQPVKFAFGSQSAKKLAGHYMFMQHMGSGSSNRWMLYMMDSQTYKTKYSLFR